MLQSLMFMWLYRFKNFVAIMKVLTEQWQWTLKNEELLAFEFLTLINEEELIVWFIILNGQTILN